LENTVYIHRCYGPCKTISGNFFSKHAGELRPLYIKQIEKRFIEDPITKEKERKEWNQKKTSYGGQKQAYKKRSTRKNQNRLLDPP
jgi:hypothetical protein